MQLYTEGLWYMAPQPSPSENPQGTKDLQTSIISQHQNRQCWQGYIRFDNIPFSVIAQVTYSESDFCSTMSKVVPRDQLQVYCEFLAQGQQQEPGAPGESSSSKSSA